MTFEGYMTLCRQEKERYPSCRWGQVFFNVLADHRPDLAEQIRATTLDPFHFDGFSQEVVNFLFWVGEHWNEEATVSPSNEQGG